ncbi:MEDS domain-containing protein [Sinomonas soli]
MRAHTGLPTAAAPGPARHLAWAYPGLAEFEGRVASFLVQGHIRGERQILISEDPKASRWPKRLLERGDLLLLSTAEAYGSTRVIGPTWTRAAFEATLAEAAALGYTGLCIAADNTALASRPEQLEAWTRWEDEAGTLMKAHPITALCAFDRTRTGPPTLEALMRLHQNHCHPDLAPHQRRWSRLHRLRAPGTR